MLYLLSDALVFLLGRLFQYRKKVILQNLRIAFPQHTPDEHHTIRMAFYRNFCDLLLESLKGLNMSEESLRSRYRYLNVEQLDQAADQHGGVILLGSHLTNWEWGVLSFPLWLQTRVLGIFKPLNHPYLNRFLNHRRCRFGLHLSSMQQAGRAIVNYREQATIYVLIADQSPSDTRNAHWIPFFGKETAFLQGPDKIARKTGYPVYQFDIRRIRRGHYEVSFELIAERPGDLPPKEITQRFARRLEERIREQPADWLWSHRRWKWSRK